MLKHFFIEDWLLKHGQINNASLCQTQREQAYARLAFASSGLIYLYLHASPSFIQYQTTFLWVSAAYFLTTLLSIPSIHRQPLSTFRMLLFPLFDTFVVTFAMLMDGGLSSGIYFLLLVIIFGNSFRFGNAMLRYSQVCSLLTLIAMAVFIDIYTPEHLDYTLLGWQIIALLIIPLYIHLVDKKAEIALKLQMEAEESAFLLMDKGPISIFTFELNDKQTPHITYANSAMRELFKLDHNQLIKSHVDIITLPEDKQELLQFCQSVLKQDNSKQKRSTQNIYIRGQDQTGKVLKLMYSAISMRWRSHWIGVCFIHDITQRETMQEELESMQRNTYMSTLVAGIVHDFRNVLTNMIGYAEVMQMNTANTTEQQQLEAIISAGDRGSELITHLLNLGKSSNPYTQQPGFTAGEALIKPLENIIGLARLQLPQHIQLICGIDDSLHDVSISITEIEQVLLNLINNSTQAISNTGYIDIQIRNDSNHALAKPDHPCLSIQVSDNGCGIGADNLDTIFKPFWTSRSHQGGSGLGLTMVQRIIKRNHGDINVLSTPNQKTTFSIHLPPYIPNTTQTENSRQNNQTSKKTTLPLKKNNDPQSYHALVVDDVPDILKIHQAMLLHMNITSELAENGQIALDNFQHNKHRFDLLITDYKMPVMDGLTLIKEIRSIHAKLPIIMVSAFGEDDQLQQVLKHNVTLLNKPINMEKLQSSITQAMTYKAS